MFAKQISKVSFNFIEVRYRVESVLIVFHWVFSCSAVCLDFFFLSQVSFCPILSNQ